MKCRIPLLLAVWVFSWPAVKAESLILRVGYDDYCPYTCVNAPQKGFALDILEWIMAQHDARLEPVIGSWPRIKIMAQKGQLDLILPVNQKETAELSIARTQRSIGSSAAGYFVHKNSKWVYKGPESLRNEIIGTVQGYAYPPPLSMFLADAHFQDRQLVLASDQGNMRQIKMLASNRVTVVPVERIVFWYTARQLGLSHEFKEAGPLDMPKDIAQFYFGVASKNSSLAPKLLSWLDQGLADLTSARKLQEIMKRYGVEALP